MIYFSFILTISILSSKRMSKSHKLALEQSLKIHLLEVQVIGVGDIHEK